MTNEAGFYVTRALIGAFESGFIPGAVLYTSCVAQLLISFHLTANGLFKPTSVNVATGTNQARWG
jgi:hypothetical protein